MDIDDQLKAKTRKVIEKLAPEMEREIASWAVAMLDSEKKVKGLIANDQFASVCRSLIGATILAINFGERKPDQDAGRLEPRETIATFLAAQIISSQHFRVLAVLTDKLEEQALEIARLKKLLEIAEKPPEPDPFDNL